MRFLPLSLPYIRRGLLPQQTGSAENLMPTPPGSFSCRPPSGCTAREGLQGKHVSDKEHQVKPKTPRTMMKKVNIVMKATHAWTQEDEERLTARLVDNFYDLINRSEEDGLYWTASQCDLIELAHIVWTSGALMDRRGRPMDFQTIVHHICRVLHVHEPRNPSSVVSAVRARKNVRVGPLRERYMQLVTKVHIQDPMRLEIRRGRRPGRTF